MFPFEYIHLFPPKEFLAWYIDQYGFIQMEVVNLED